MTFKDLGLIAPILKALDAEGYTHPTPIQEQSIPVLLTGKDLLGCAQTGTGKTAAFAAPIIQQLYNDRPMLNGQRKIRALVVTPTRELAIQINDSFTSYGKFTALKSTVIFGGVKQGAQTRDLANGTDILVATPGRLLDLISQGFITLKEIKYFVLDEADRMLDMGFIHDIRRIIEMLPEKRQSLFFSATMPDNIIALSKKILYKPEYVEISPGASAADTIKQLLYYTDRTSKKDLLVHILKDQNIDQVLLFSRTKHGADRISRNLRKQKISTDSIHGDKAQNQRQKALAQFKAGDIRVLVATDIAARGIDIDNLKYVINYDIPNIAETYVHRIGRSGRAGASGTSISLCEPEENAFIKEIEKLIRQKIEVVKNNPFPQTTKIMTDQEKKEWEKEKQRKKQEFFAGRSRNQNRSNSSGSYRGR